MTNEVSLSNIDETIDSIIKSKVSNIDNLDESFDNLSKKASVKSKTKHLKDKNGNSKVNKDFDHEQLSNSINVTNFKDPNNLMKCYINKDNTISFLDNANTFTNDKGEVFYACLKSAATITQQDQILQLIPQNQVVNRKTPIKVVSPKIVGNQFINTGLSDDQLPLSPVSKQKCGICDVEFPSKRAYLKHMTIHDNDRQFKCQWCKVSYNHDVNLLVHVAIIHPNRCTVDVDEHGNNFHCMVCSLKFSRMKAFQGHCLIHQIDEELYCEQCSASFNSRVRLDNHMVDQHKIRKQSSRGSFLHCRICNATCDAVGHMKRHYRLFHQKSNSENEKIVVKKECEDDQNLDPECKRRRTSKIATETIKLYAKNSFHKNAPSGEIRRRGRPPKVVRMIEKEKLAKTLGGIETKAVLDKSSEDIVKETATVVKKRGRPPIVRPSTEETEAVKKQGNPTVVVSDPEEPLIVKKRGRQSAVFSEIDESAVSKAPEALPLDNNIKEQDVSLETVDEEWSENRHDGPRKHDEKPVVSIRKRGRPPKFVNGEGSMNTTCRRCNRTFKTAILLRRHEVTHTGVKDFQCPLCEKKFTQKSSVKIHMAVHDDTKSYLCPHCEKPFTYEHNMQTHVRAVHQRYPPLHTSPTDMEKAGLPRIQRMHMSNFATSTPMVDRNQSHMSQEVSVTVKRKISSRCRLCKITKRAHCVLCRYVQQTKATQQPYKCNTCHRSFYSRSVLQTHRLSHIQLSEHRCEKCSKSFCRPQTLRVHRKLCDNGKSLKYRCNKCSKRFVRSESFVKHVSTAHPPQPIKVSPKASAPAATIVYQDTGAGMTLTVDTGSADGPIKTYILQERAAIAAYRPFKCNQCHKSYKLRRYLRDHLKDHKTYNNRKSCHYCTKTFLTVRSLQQHTRTQHINRRIFACPICPSTFILKASLIRHGLVHTTVKPYACPMCLRQFKAKLYCDRHINQQKCPNLAKDGATGVPNAEIEPEKLSGAYCPYRLVDADHGADSSANALMNNFDGEEFSGDKFMVVNLDNDGEQHLYNGDTVFYPTVVPARGTLADKYPLLKATLFTDDDMEPVRTRIPMTVDTNMVAADIDAAINGVSVLDADNSPQYYHGCSMCDEQFPDSSELISHVKETHSVAKDYQCMVCSKTFAIELSLWAHLKIHGPNNGANETHQCRACNNSFASVPSLSRHVRMSHNDTLNYYRCTHCDQTYKTTRELDSHIKLLTVDYDALIINASMVAGDSNDDTVTNVNVGDIDDPRRRSDAYRHLPAEIKNPNRVSNRYQKRLNESEIDEIANLDISTTSKCSVQELIKAAREKRGLLKKTRKRHVDHDEDYYMDTFPFQCPECSKCFKRSSNLQQHLSVHTKANPFECVKCNRKFRHRCSLKTHEQTKHSGLMKLLRCHLCQKLLRSRVALGTHMKKHLKNYPIECDRCGHALATLSEEKVHRKQCKQNVSKQEATTSHLVPLPKPPPQIMKRKSKLSTMLLASEDHLVEIEPDCPLVSPLPRPPQPLSPESCSSPAPIVIKCVACGTGFSSFSDYSNHQCTKQKRKSHQCVVCNDMFPSSHELCEHICYAHQQLTDYNCSLCNLLFVNESLLITHQRTVHNL